MQVPFDSVLPRQVNTNATLIALGHYHKAFDHVEGFTRFINPGSTSRWAINEQHTPQVLLLDTVTKNITYISLKSSRPAREIFDLQAAMEIESREMELNKFVESLEGTSFEAIDIYEVVKQAGLKQAVSSDIIKEALEKIMAAKENLK